VLGVAKNGQNAQFTQEKSTKLFKTAKIWYGGCRSSYGKEGMSCLAGVQTIEHGSFMDKEIAVFNEIIHLSANTLSWKVC
jgi:hypothetical protein